MNEHTGNRPRSTEEDSDAALAALLRLAGPRPDIPRDLEKRVEARVYGEWQRTQQRKRFIRWSAPFALAATVVVALVLAVRPDVPPSAQVIGTVVRLVPGIDGSLPDAGSAVRIGDTLLTGRDSSIGVDLSDGTSLRLGPGSQLGIVAENEFRLLRGAAYVDTGPAIYRAHAISVHTPLARIRDVGTQFLVNYSDEGLQVAVREGRVEVSADADSHTAVAGEQLHLQPDLTARIAPVSSHASLWQWAASVAPPFDIENRSLMDFLKWASRESGRELEFASDQQRMAAMRTVLHGSIEGFSIDEAIDSVLATSGFSYQLADDRIVIE